MGFQNFIYRYTSSANADKNKKNMSNSPSDRHVRPVPAYC